MRDIIGSISTLNWIDWSVIILILLMGFAGLKNGFIKEAFGIVIWFIGALAAYYFADMLANKYTGLNSSDVVRFWVFFIPILILVWVGAKLIAWMLPNSLSDSESTSIIDKVFGFLLGAAKALFVISIIFSILNTVPYVTSSKPWHNSILTPYILKTSSWIKVGVSNELHTND